MNIGPMHPEMASDWRDRRITELNAEIGRLRAQMDAAINLLNAEVTMLREVLASYPTPASIGPYHRWTARREAALRGMVAAPEPRRPDPGEPDTQHKKPKLGEK